MCLFSGKDTEYQAIKRFYGLTEYQHYWHSL